jgi:hypothetical protein
VKTEEGKAASRCNSLRDGLRARVVFPPDMAQAITELTEELADDYSPRSRFEWFLVREIGRTTVQYEAASELSVKDAVRVAQRAEGIDWDDDRRASADRLGGRVRKDPRRIAQELASTPHGTEWLLYNWEGLGDSLRSNGRWTEPQRELAYDLLGVAEVLRPGSVKVPAADDAPALESLVEREIERLRDRLPRLITQARAAQVRAARGVPTEPDAETRRLRSDASRAHRRLKWAKATLDALRGGADPSTLVDPETKRPIEAWDEHPRAAARPAQSAAAPPPKVKVPDSWAEVDAACPAREMPPIPEGLSPEMQEMFAVGFELVESAKESGELPDLLNAAAQPPPPPASQARPPAA